MSAPEEPILVGVTIQVNSCYCGSNLKTIQLSENCIWLGLVRKGQVILASGAEELTIYWGDYILALALKRAIAPTLRSILKKTHPITWSPLQSSLNRESNSPVFSYSLFNCSARR